MIYLMSDIHGNMRRYRSIMEQIDLKPDDTLYVLGDVIDRHPYGIDILEEIMATPNIKMILGNHEHMMLNAIYPYKDGLPWKYVQSWKTVALWYQNDGEITKKALSRRTEEQRSRIFAYLKSLPINIDIEVNAQKFKLVHAAPVECFSNNDIWDYIDETEYAVWKRRFDFDSLPGDYVMIFGHTPTIHYQDNRILTIWQNRRGTAIGIDCGSGFDDDISDANPVQGRLACLRLDDMKEFYSQENTELVMELTEDDIQQDFQNA